MAVTDEKSVVAATNVVMSAVERLGADGFQPDTIISALIKAASPRQSRQGSRAVTLRVRRRQSATDQTRARTARTNSHSKLPLQASVRRNPNPIMAGGHKPTSAPLILSPAQGRTSVGARMLPSSRHRSSYQLECLLAPRLEPHCRWLQR